MKLNEEYLRPYILDNLDIGIRVVNLKGEIIYFNEKIKDLFGLENFSEDIYSQDINPLANTTLMNSIKTGAIIRNKVKLLPNKNNQLQYFVVTNLPIKIGGEIVAAIEYIKTEDSYGDLFRHLVNKIKKKNFRKSSKGYTFDDFLTIEKDLTQLISRLKKISKYNYNVAITGETGTGKEIIAQSIHNESARADRPFVAQNCAAIPENLLESIFFGSVEGAFTGAKDQKGLFEQADGGTLLLDELNSLPMYLQAKLLRVLEEGEIRPVGGSKDIRVDVRLISTTNENLQVLIEENRLREDLYYRLGPIYVDLTALRHRKSDIDYLSKVFVKRESSLMDIVEPKISREVRDIFREYNWPGNVRELRNLIQIILLNNIGAEEIRVEDLPRDLVEKSINKAGLEMTSSLGSYIERVEDFEREIIKRALKFTDGNISNAAKILKIKRPTLQYKIKNLGIEVD